MKATYTVTLPNGKPATFKTAKPTTHVIALKWSEKIGWSASVYCKSLEDAKKQLAKFTPELVTAGVFATLTILPVNA